jgi:hypothetical protein
MTQGRHIRRRRIAYLVVFMAGVVALAFLFGPLLLILGLLALPLAWRSSRPVDPEDPSQYPRPRR